jgi:hypothetical protein
MTVTPWQPSARPARWRRLAKRGGKILAVVLAAVTLMCCAGIGYVAYDLHRAPQEERAIEAFAQGLCVNLIAGNEEVLYAALSAGSQHRYSREVVAGGLATRPRPISCEVDDAAFVFLLVAYVTVTMSYPAEARQSYGRHTFDLVKQDGRWKVDSDILRDLDGPPRHIGGGGID